MSEFLVLIAPRPGATAEDLAATRRSLAVQAGVTVRSKVIQGMTAPFDWVTAAEPAGLLTLLGAGDVLLPAALRSLRAAFAENPKVRFAHGLVLPAELARRLTRDTAWAYVEELRRRAPLQDDQSPALAGTVHLVHGAPTLRPDTLRLDPAHREADLFSAFRKVAAQLAPAQTRLVPQILCVSPAVGRSSTGLRSSLAIRWWRAGRKWAGRFGPRAYRALGGVLQRQLFGRPTRSARPRRPAGSSPLRVGYVIWRYPEHGAIERELEALGASGVAVEIVAKEPGGSSPNPNPVGPVTYYGAVPVSTVFATIRRLLLRRPWTLVSCWIAVVRHEYPRGSNARSDLEVLFEAARLSVALASRGVNHIHSPWAHRSALLAALAARLLRVTYSVEGRASDLHRHWERTGLGHRVKDAAFIVANSEYNRRHLLEVLGNRESPAIHLIYEGLDLPTVQFRTNDLRTEGPTRLLAVGRLVEPKGFRHLLHACHTLRERGITVRCDIFGGPEQFDSVTWVELRMLLSELRLETTVRFWGAQPMPIVLKALEQADLFVLPCVRARDGSHDISPNSLLEAMAVGLPVIATTSGAIPEIVDDGLDGLLVPPGDEAALAAAIERLIRDPALRRRLGRAARAKIEDRFDAARNGQRLAELFLSFADVAGEPLNQGSLS